MAYRNFQVPLVFIIYKRPEQTLQVFRVIREVKPTKLYVIADGPKNHDDTQKCYQTRKIIDAVDWECDVKKNFSETNMGLHNRVVSGLDWVFKQEETAIILEDDCLPDTSFFYYSEDLLERYKNDTRIGIISGDLFIKGQEYENSYYFSNFPHIWGWATWKRTWENYDSSMKEWPRFRNLRWLTEKTGSEYYARIWLNIFNSVHQQKIDTWAYQVVFMLWTQSQFSIAPNRNLVSNIGFGADSTHTKDASDRFSLMPSEKMVFPLVHPHLICRDLDNDLLESRAIFGSSITIPKKFINKIKKIFGRLYNV
jgi:hypothetical protein